jgi:AbrB family looped-hinge helix DNA binding protein
MAKVTSKLQVTVPKAIAEEFNIRPGSHIDWISAGDIIRVIPPGAERHAIPLALRLRLFDQATERLRQRGTRKRGSRPPAHRGWKREDLYRRGRAS